VSWVQFGRGWRTDLAALGELCTRHGALLCADVIQGLGVLPADLAAWGVDFAMADGHKYLLGPEGIGVLYVAERSRHLVRPSEVGWASVVHRGEWENLELVLDPSARRFEGGTANLAGTMGLGVSIRLLLDTTVEAIWAHVDRLCDHVVDGLGTVGATVLSDRSRPGRSGIVSFVVDGLDTTELADSLRADGFVVAPRGGGVRVAPHGYNTVDELDALVEAVAQRRR
jgi:selenocysteine lyase/cysteine desulfurase